LIDSKPMKRIVSATEARVHLGAIMREIVEKGEHVVVERGGRPYVVMLSVEEYEHLCKKPDRGVWRALVLRARERVREDVGDRPIPPPEEIIRTSREERDAGFLDLH